MTVTELAMKAGEVIFYVIREQNKCQFLSYSYVGYIFSAKKFFILFFFFFFLGGGGVNLS